MKECDSMGVIRLRALGNSTLRDFVASSAAGGVGGGRRFSQGSSCSYYKSSVERR